MHNKICAITHAVAEAVYYQSSLDASPCSEALTGQ